ncbi:bifunctional DNA primase/polymerase [Gammaproteobacteria bacterium]|nr:bifunctional DNA primase/polymerase [Gammaproteobacteria bacterium]
MNSPLGHALQLARRGIPVFPCNQNKSPATKNGFKDATLGTAKIKNWFANGQYLVAAPTGTSSGLFVLDVDPDGQDWIAERFDQLACERVHQTNRGQHFIYRWPECFQGRSTSAGLIAPGIDTRGEGGYVVWWAAHGKEAVGDLDSLTEPPTWLMRQLQAARRDAPQKIDNSALICKEGQRNTGLASLAGNLRRAGMNEQQILKQLTTFNEDSCLPPLQISEVEGIARSISRYEPEAPIHQATPTPSSSLDWLNEFKMTEQEVQAISDPAWVIPDFIHSGHVIAIAAEPGAGKTTILFHLCKSLTRSFEVVYVHADTNPTDAKDYWMQAEIEGITYLTPDMKVGLSMEDVVRRLQSLSQSDADLNNQVWVFDTLKKMTDVIQKKNLKDLLQTMRKLSNRGMTIVLLCHTNKHRDADGNRIFEGTGDLKSDVDELIYLDPLKQPDGKLVVSTRPDKVRADIRPLTFEVDAQRQVTQRDEFIDVPSLVADEFKRGKDDQIIEAITEALNQSKNKQVEIIAHCNKTSGIGEHKVRMVLKRYSANGPNQQWNAEKQTQHNTWRYTLLNSRK